MCDGLGGNPRRPVRVPADGRLVVATAPCGRLRVVPVDKEDVN